MPRIVQYESQVGTQGPVGQRRAVAEDFGGGSALMQAGRQVGEFADVLAQREDQREVSDLNARMAQASADWSIRLDETLNTAQPGDTGIAERYLNEFDAFADKLGENATTRTGQRYLQGAVADLRSQLQVQVIGGQAKLVGLKARQDYETAIGVSANAVITDPSGFDAAMRRQAMALAVAVESGTLSPAVAAELGRSSASTLGAAQAQGFIKQDPRAALDALNAGQWDQYIGPDQKLALLSHAEVEVRRLETEARQRQAEAQAAYLADFDNTVAFLRDGGSLPTNPYNRDRLVSIFGPDKGGELADTVEGAAAFGKVVSAVKFATPEEIAALVAAEGGDLASPDDYKNQRAELSTLMGAIDDRNKALLADPASFVQSAPTVQTTYQAMADVLNDPMAAPDARREATAAYATAALAEQERLGLSREQQRLLPPAYADQIAARFRFQPEGGENAAAIIQGLADQWGKYWPQVAGELQDKLPGTAKVIASMPAGSAAERLAEAANLGAGTLAKTLPNDAVKSMREALPDALADFRATIVNQPGGESTYATYAEQAELLALKYMSEGRAPGDAAAKAAADVAVGRYTFVGTYRVPIDQDAAKIERGAAVALGLLDGAGLDLPRSLFGLNDAQTRAAWLATVRDQGVWITAPDESGLVLHVPGADGLLVAVTINGKPVLRTWAELMERPAKPTTPIPAFQE